MSRSVRWYACNWALLKCVLQISKQAQSLRNISNMFLMVECNWSKMIQNYPRHMKANSPFTVSISCLVWFVVVCNHTCLSWAFYGCSWWKNYIVLGIVMGNQKHGSNKSLKLHQTIYCCEDLQDNIYVSKINAYMM